MNLALSVEQSEEVQKQEQEAALQSRLEELKLQLDQTEADIIRIRRCSGSILPSPAPTSTPASRFSRTPTPAPTPTLSPEEQIAYKEEQNRLDQLQTLRDLYKQTYANLLVLGGGMPAEQERIPRLARINYKLRLRFTSRSIPTY